MTEYGHWNEKLKMLKKQMMKEVAYFLFALFKNRLKDYRGFVTINILAYSYSETANRYQHISGAGSWYKVLK